MAVETDHHADLRAFDFYYDKMKQHLDPSTMQGKFLSVGLINGNNISGGGATFLPNNLKMEMMLAEVRSSIVLNGPKNFDLLVQALGKVPIYGNLARELSKKHAELKGKSIIHANTAEGISGSASNVGTAMESVEGQVQDLNRSLPQNQQLKNIPYKDSTKMTKVKLQSEYKKRNIIDLTKNAGPITTQKKLDKVIKNLKNYSILIEVVNEIEFMAAICQMNGEIYLCTVCDKLTSSDSDYYYGEWKNVPVVIVQTGTKVGSQFQYGSWFQTKKALYFMPEIKYIFGVGVCGVVADGKLVKSHDSLGHVVISSHIIGYDHQKKLDEGDESRSFVSQHPEHSFYRYVFQKKRDWDDWLHFGKVLSGSWLIADENAQLSILKSCGKDGIAFEMEGVGISAACDSIKAGSTKVECLVVKGVSDYANREKNDEWQPAAASNATHYLSVMINEKFSPLELWPN